MKLYLTIGVTLLMTIFSACGRSLEAPIVVSASSVKSAVATVKPEDNRVFSIEKKLLSDRNNTFKGDFNGDGIEDLLYVVDAAAIHQDLPASVKVVHPWKYYGEGSVSVSSAPKSKTGFIVQLGSTTQKKINYFIADVNSPSLLDTEAANELSLSKISALDAEDAKHLKKYAKGDVVIIPTEAGVDTYLYWTGDTFAAYEPLSSP